MIHVGARASPFPNSTRLMRRWRDGRKSSRSSCRTPDADGPCEPAPCAVRCLEILNTEITGRQPMSRSRGQERDFVDRMLEEIDAESPGLDTRPMAAVSRV